MKKESEIAVTTPKKQMNGKIKTAETSEGKENGFSPIFVEAEKMFDRLADLTKETAQKAFEFFQKRGGEIGKELDDWFQAEREILMPVPVEVIENNDNFTVRAAVPGFKPEEIEVSVKDKMLILTGKTEFEEKKEDENTVYSEWRSNRFCRQLPLKSAVDAEKVEATLKDGVLLLTLPKLPAREPKKISVAAG